MTWCATLQNAEVLFGCHDIRMELQLAVSAPSNSHPFAVYVEPEGMMYGFPETGRVVLAFRGPDAMTAEITHRPDTLIIWRPADTEVWATTLDGNMIESLFHPNQTQVPEKP